MPLDQDYGEFLAEFESGKFQELWPAQEYILEQYSREYHQKNDIAIELPTGAGKTLIALLIAETWRQQNKKVAILSANKTLARQMANEADELGIPSVLMEGRGKDIPSRDKRGYRRANHVAIMNYWVYINQNPVVDAADLLIMDDAHLAEQCLHSLWSVEISKHDHATLFTNIVSELKSRFPGYRVLYDALDDNQIPNTPPELLSFIDQIEISQRLREIIDTSPILETDSDLEYRWRRMRNSLNESNIYCSVNSIWIRPYIYPFESNSQYYNTAQRIYLSATIGNPGDLGRRLGVRGISKILVTEEYAHRTNGRRFIIMNRISDEDLPKRLEDALLEALNVSPKSLWLCNSLAIADKYKLVVSEWLNGNDLVGHPTLLLTSLGDEIDQFKKADLGHLFVGGRFDGMDFDGDECRIVIVTTLPKAINIQEEFMSAYLRDASFLNRRLNQRIIQALGRSNRSDEDYAIYVLADRRFATHFSRENNRRGIPSNLVAEIDYAEDSAEVDINDLINRIDRFLNGDFQEFDQNIQELMEDVPEQEADRNDRYADIEVLAWSALFSSQNYEIAAQNFEDCWNTALEENLRELGAFYGWCWAKARYLSHLQEEPGAREDSLDILERAINRGGNSSWFNRLRTSLNRARQDDDAHQTISDDEYANAVIYEFDELLEKVGIDGNRFQKWQTEVFASLNSESHDQFQQGLLKLGGILGYNARIPQHQSSTDCMWRGVFGNARELVTLEAKIEHEEGQSISASNVGQAHNQLGRAQTEFEGQGYLIRGTIVTHLEDMTDDARSALAGIKIIKKDAIIELFNHVTLLISRYRDNWSYDNVEARLTAANIIRPQIPPSGWLVRAIDNDEIIVTIDILLSEWEH